MVEGTIELSDMEGIAKTIGLVGTIVLTLLFSKKAIESSIDHQTRRGDCKKAFRLHIRYIKYC
jgi:hypothetical protein